MLLLVMGQSSRMFLSLTGSRVGGGDQFAPFFIHFLVARVRGGKSGSPRGFSLFISSMISMPWRDTG